MVEDQEYTESNGDKVVLKPDGTKITYSGVKRKKPKQKRHKKYVVLIIILLLVSGVIGTVAYIKHRNHEIWLAEQPKCSHPAIKGNISYRTGAKIYHAPWDHDYNRTVIDTSTGERWFCTEQDAKAAGWRHTQAY